tara:strand:- start:5747 stop:7306 length:1560 start_codon:yes stop_codon:yes gene_type:complete
MALIRSLEDSRVKNLKSLSYGANKPLVTKDINKNPSPQGIGLEASRRLDDLERISKFFISPSGVKYLGNEALLQQVGLGQKIRDAKASGKTTGGAILQQLGKTALTTGKLVGSTLAQIPVNGTGTHFYRGFLQDTSTYLGNIPAFGQKTVNTDSIIGDNINQESFSIFKEGNYVPVQPKGDGVVPVDTPAPIQDFRKDNNNSYSLDYTDQKIKRETRVNLGNQGYKKQIFPITGYTHPIEGPEIDGINMLPPIKLNWDARGRTTDDGTRELYDKEALGTGKSRDLIKFRFEVVTPDDATMLYFRAYLDSFDDNYNADWSKNSYLGRGEAFYTYGGFDRSISLGFKIAAATRHEMQPLYQKMVYLASSTAPTYSNNFMRGTLVNLTVGDYVYNLPGFIEQVNYNWQTDYPWEIAMSKPEGTGQDDDMQELPHVLDCKVNFRPIHRFTPQTGLYHYVTNPGFGKPKSNLFFAEDGSTNPLDSQKIVKAENFRAYRLQPKLQQEGIANNIARDAEQEDELFQ